MPRPWESLLAAVLLVLGAPLTVVAQPRPDPAALLKVQRDALAPLAFMDGQWRGPAWTLRPSGAQDSLIQTERVGPFLDGAIKVLEGRGYTSAGDVTFNAFGTISYDPAQRAYTLHSYAQGRVGDFVLMPTSDGFRWTVPAGPITIRYTAVIKDGVWREVGDRIGPGKDTTRIFEMTLTRLGATDWPAAGAVRPK